jgi:hypothetical protein
VNPSNDPIKPSNCRHLNQRKSKFTVFSKFVAFLQQVGLGQEMPYCLRVYTTHDSSFKELNMNNEKIK